MLCFRVSRNGQHLTTAGVPGFGVVSAILTWVRREDDASNSNPELTLNVGGYEGDEFLTWYDASVRAGDVLTLEVRDDLTADAPSKRSSAKEAGMDLLSQLRAEKKQLEARLVELVDELRVLGEE